MIAILFPVFDLSAFLAILPPDYLDVSSTVLIVSGGHTDGPFTPMHARRRPARPAYQKSEISNPAASLPKDRAAAI
jgi:hypothetical protein